MDNFKLPYTLPLSFTIPVAPMTKKNHQQIIMIQPKKGSGEKPKRRVMPSKEYMQYQAKASWYLKPYGINEPVNCKAVFYVASKRKVDRTNLEEALHDLLTHAGVIEDDNVEVIVSGDGTRVYYDPVNPRTEVTFTSEPPTFVVERKKKNKKRDFS